MEMRLGTHSIELGNILKDLSCPLKHLFIIVKHSTLFVIEQNDKKGHPCDSDRDLLGQSPALVQVLVAGAN